MEPIVTDGTPTFAIVGAVNHGKSSVVSTLAEDDQIKISAMPGETVECQRFWLLDLFVFYDTPGFQNALEALIELAPAAQASEPLSVFRHFIQKHKGEVEFEAECQLFQPIIAGAGVVYVVDGSEPLLEIHKAEMEILRMTGQPRLAIINRTGTDDHVQDWKRRLGLHFNAVREFNAHHATFANRLELLETLAGIEQSWKPKLMKAVTLVREDWERRLTECAEILVNMLSDCLTHEERSLLQSEAQRQSEERALVEKFQKTISSYEASAHKAIIKLFRHELIKSETTAGDLFEEGLFSEQTWSLFGCSQQQLVALASVGGAAGGAMIDVMFGGHSLGAFALGGMAIGAAGALFAGKTRPEIELDMPRNMRWLSPRLKVAGTTLRVPPYPALNFPWILVDRSIAIFHYAIHRTHARRDKVRINSAEEKAKMAKSGVSTDHWPASVRRDCQKRFTAIRNGKHTPKAREELRELLRAQLVAVSNS